MRILGLCHDVLICSAALIEDGTIVAASAEERLDRVKQSRYFPARAIQFCLDRAGIAISDVDEIVVAWNPGIDLETAPAGFLDRRWRTEHLAQVPARLMKLFAGQATPRLRHEGIFAGCPPVVYIDHYLSHAGNAMFLSPFSDAAVAILDGRGERQTALLGAMRGVDLEVVEEVEFPHSIGLFYGAFTQFFGFRPDCDEWKVMALASYGAGNDDNPYVESVRRLIRVDDRGRFRIDLEKFGFFNFWDRNMYADLFVEAFGTPRKRGEPIEDWHRDLAAALQIVFEEVVAKMLTILHQRTGLKNLVAAGGCFMNSVFNGKITSVTPFQNLYISSCPDDSGTSVGAALYRYYARAGKRTPAEVMHNYWGSNFSDRDCKEALARYKIASAEVADPARCAAEDLAAGKLVGWFQGAAEFGQRALGARSILADPRPREARDKINAAVKYRESFRPFAPAILAERVAEYFECEPGTRVPFMERVLMFRRDKRKEVPAVVHVDGSGRLQTVDEHNPPRYRQLIEAFAELTGVPIVLNTSFNLNGEPIVDSPTDAIRTFFSCGLDVLYLGNRRVAK